MKCANCGFLCGFAFVDLHGGAQIQLTKFRVTVEIPTNITRMCQRVRKRLLPHLHNYHNQMTAFTVTNATDMAQCEQLHKISEYSQLWNGPLHRTPCRVPSPCFGSALAANRYTDDSMQPLDLSKTIDLTCPSPTKRFIRTKKSSENERATTVITFDDNIEELRSSNFFNPVSGSSLDDLLCTEPKSSLSENVEQIDMDDNSKAKSVSFEQISAPILGKPNLIETISSALHTVSSGQNFENDVFIDPIASSSKEVSYYQSDLVEIIDCSLKDTSREHAVKETQSNDSFKVAEKPIKITFLRDTSNKKYFPEPQVISTKALDSALITNEFEFLSSAHHDESKPKYLTRSKYSSSFKRVSYAESDRRYTGKQIVKKSPKRKKTRKVVKFGIAKTSKQKSKKFYSKNISAMCIEGTSSNSTERTTSEESEVHEKYAVECEDISPVSTCIFEATEPMPIKNNEVIPFSGNLASCSTQERNESETQNIRAASTSEDVHISVAPAVFTTFSFASEDGMNIVSDKAHSANENISSQYYSTALSPQPSTSHMVSPNESAPLVDSIPHSLSQTEIPFLTDHALYGSNNPSNYQYSTEDTFGNTVDDDELFKLLDELY